MIALIGAMDEEVEDFISRLHQPKKVAVHDVEFTEGLWNNKEVVVVKSGIGKIAAATATTILCLKYQNLSHVINVGSAGSLYNTFPIGTILFADEYVAHDFECDLLNLDLNITGAPLRIETSAKSLDIMSKYKKNDASLAAIGTGDFFASSEEKVNSIKQRFPNVVAVEMEGYAVAYVCYKFKVPMLGVRVVSDVAGQHNTTVDFNSNLKSVSSKCARVVAEVLAVL